MFTVVALSSMTVPLPVALLDMVPTLGADTVMVTRRLPING